MKKLIIFDLDGTLAESKAAIDTEMARLLHSLINTVKVAIISGGDWPQFQKQVISHLPKDTRFSNLYILPTCGTKFFRYDGKDWQKLYSEDFTAAEKKKIISSIQKSVEQSGVKPEKTWGEQIEDRDSQITFSALGQQAPLKPKQEWDPHFDKRRKMKAVLDKLIPEFAVNLGGATSVDITKPGIDKAYGIHKLKEVLNIPITKMLFIGDALFKGGNDHPAKTTGAKCIQTLDPKETKHLIDAIVSCMDEV